MSVSQEHPQVAQRAELPAGEHLAEHIENEAELVVLLEVLCEGALLTDCPTLSHTAALLAAMYELLAERLGPEGVKEAFSFVRSLEARREVLELLGSPRASVAASFADAGWSLADWLFELRLDPATGELASKVDPARVAAAHEVC